jgi:hypothetical protein
MGRTTPPPSQDITAVFGELRRYSRRAVRLHPRAGTPGPDDSSLGGPLRWPAGTDWPTCTVPHTGFDRVLAPATIRSMDQAIRWATATPGIALIEYENGRFVGSRHVSHLPEPPVPLVPVLQLYARDVADLPFPGDSDVLQVLWCPNDHGMPWAGPHPITIWRRAADVTGPPAEPPAPRFDDEDFAQRYVSLPCVLHPEPVVEYPDVRDLPADLGEQVERWDAEHDRVYCAALSTAPGTKTGGHPAWIQDPSWPVCGCGARMEHLLTIASKEFLGVRWLAVEDRADPAATGQKPVTDRDCWAPHGIMLGDVGSMYLFTCPRCQDRPLAGSMQCV